MVGSIGASAMRRRSEKADGGAGTAFGDDRFTCFLACHAFRPVAAGVDLCRAVFAREGRQRPDHIDEIFVISLFALPQIVIAVGNLSHFAGTALDGLRTVELQYVPRRTQHTLT